MNTIKISKLWKVWGDAREPLAVNLLEEAMMNIVDKDTTNTYYGEDEDGVQYYGGKKHQTVSE